MWPTKEQWFNLQGPLAHRRRFPRSKVFAWYTKWVSGLRLSTLESTGLPKLKQLPVIDYEETETPPYLPWLIIRTWTDSLIPLFFSLVVGHFDKSEGASRWIDASQLQCLSAVTLEAQTTVWLREDVTYSSWTYNAESAFCPASDLKHVSPTSRCNSPSGTRSIINTAVRMNIIMIILPISTHPTLGWKNHDDFMFGSRVLP